MYFLGAKSIAGFDRTEFTCKTARIHQSGREIPNKEFIFDVYVMKMGEGQGRSRNKGTQRKAPISIEDDLLGKRSVVKIPSLGSNKSNYF